MQDTNTKYQTSKDEIELLVPALKIYFSYPQRTIERSNIVQEVVSKLSIISKHWNPITVRKWFINNMQQYVKNYIYASPPPFVEEERFQGCPDWINHYLNQEAYDQLPKDIKHYYDRLQEKTFEMRRKTAQFQNTQSVHLQPQAQVNEAQPIQIQQQHQAQAQVYGVQVVQLQPQAQFQNTKSVQFQPQNQVHVAQPVQIQQQQQGQVFRTPPIQLQQQSQEQFQFQSGNVIQAEKQHILVIMSISHEHLN